MSKELNHNQFRNLIRGLLKEGKLKEDDLGIWSDFDELEFDNDAMAAAKADIEASGDKFVPLGKSKFEKNLDPDQFKADLTRAKLDLPNDKQELDNITRMMNTKKKHEKRFGAGSLNETGEWSDDEEGLAWIESLRNELDLISSELNPTIHMTIEDIRGFDKYQGPYANITINGDHYKVWTNEDQGLWIENFPIDNTSKDGNKPGFAGFAPDIADAINKHYTTPYNIMDFMNEDTEELTQKNWGFDTKSLYHFLKSALAEFMEGDSHLNYAEAAMVLESELEKHFNISARMNETHETNDDEKNLSPDASKIKDLMKGQKVLRPKDAEGNDITNGARVEDLATGTAGRVLHPGVDDNGNQTIHVDWFYTFGDAIVKPVVYPKQIVVRDETRIVRENEPNGPSLEDFAKAQEEANYWVYKNNIGTLTPEENQQLNAAIEKAEQIADALDVGKYDYITMRKMIDDFAKQRNDQDYLEHGEEAEREFEKGFNGEYEIEEGGGHSHTIGKGQNKKPGNYPHNLKRVGLNENLEHTVSSDEDDMVFMVTDTPFNRTHYKDLIGQTFDNAPSNAEFDLVNRNGVKEDYDFAAAERNFHNSEYHHQDQEQYTNKKIVVSNFDDMANLVFPNKKRVQSILDDLKQELENMRVTNNTIVASDNMDTQWIFKIESTDGDTIKLKFQGTAK